MKQIEKYLRLIERMDMNLDEKDMFNDLIMTKVLPRINTSYNNKSESKYKAWESFRKEYKLCEDTEIKLSKMSESADEDNVISFWSGY